MRAGARHSFDEQEGCVAGLALESAAGWITGARRVSSPNCDARPAGAAIDLVVIHAISLPPGEFGGGYIEQLFTNDLDYAIHPYFAELVGARVSAHFFIDRQGQLSQFVATHDRAWHAGESSWRGRSAVNDFSLGIELEGCDEQLFSDAQYLAVGRLIAGLQARFPHISRECIVGHSDVAPERKTDPGPCFEWARLHKALAQ
jgi:AmpD protein